MTKSNINEFEEATGEVKIVREKVYSDGERAKVRCYGSDDVREGVDVSITGNNPMVGMTVAVAVAIEEAMK